MRQTAINIGLLSAAVAGILFLLGSVMFHSVSAHEDNAVYLAQGGTNTGGTGSGGTNTGGTGGGGTSSGGGSGGGGTSLVNPLQSQSISEFLVKIIDVILIFAVPIIIFFIIYAGFMYVTARGDSSKISTAHSALTWAVVGGVITLGAKLIIEVIKGTIATF